MNGVLFESFSSSFIYLLFFTFYGKVFVAVPKSTEFTLIEPVFK